MKKVILATVIATVLATPVMATGLLSGDEVTNVGDITIGGANSGNVASCVQSGSHGDNNCNINIENVNGNLIVNGDSVDLSSLKGDTGAQGIQGESGANGSAGKDGEDADMTKVNANTDSILALENRKDLDTQLTEAQVDEMVSDNGYLTEHQDISGLATKVTTDKLKTKQVKLESEIDIIRIDSTKRDDQLQATASKNNLASIAKDKNLQSQIQTQMEKRIEGDEKTLADAKAYADTVDTDTHRSDQSVIDTTESVRNQGDADTLSNANTYTDGKVTTQAKVDKEAREELKREVDTVNLEQDERNAQERTQLVEKQGVVDKLQDDHNQYQREQMEIAQRNVDFNQNYKITDNTANISKNTSAIAKNTAWNIKQDSQIAGLQQDVERLDGMVAANSALSSIVLTPNYNGTVALGVGIGYYKGHTAGAIALQGGTQRFQTKVSVAGSSADNFDDLVYGASVNFGF